MITKGLTNVSAIYQAFLENTCDATDLFYFQDLVITKAAFAQRVTFFTKHLIHLGVVCGATVGYTLPNSPDAYALFVAIAQLGACAMPLFHMIPDGVKAGIFTHSPAKLVITTATLFDGLQQHAAQMSASFQIVTIDKNSAGAYSFDAADVSRVSLANRIVGEDAAELPLMLASSSGTTGVPKMVVMTQGNIAAELYVSVEFTLPVPTDNNRIAMAFPMSTPGISVCLGTLLAGAAHIFTSDVSPIRFVDAVSRHRPFAMACPPAYFEAILSLPSIPRSALESVTRIYTGMDFLCPNLVARLKNRFENLEGFANGYGLIETSNVFMICKSLDKDTLLTAPTSRMAVAGNANEIKVLDEHGQSAAKGAKGELYVKGANVVSGYINNPGESEMAFKEGWFRTGDIVQYESKGTVTLLGRKKYLIKRGGKSVSPIVVQNTINELPEVASSAVVGVPHPLYGEMVWAFVVKMANATVAFKDIMKHCRNALVNYMVPDQIVFIDTLPKKSGVGKVDYDNLKELANIELQRIGVRNAKGN
ncbi:MAG: acyl--CoA ligase [Deltaproteobacteria bacterium]|nr:acyl--CoA ligase [Deltaproteobacteria bacterium]